MSQGPMAPAAATGDSTAGVLHHVFANRSNVGDWLSARAIQQLLSGTPVQEHLCDAPFVADTLAALAAAGPDDAVLIGGGGLFMDYFQPFWQGLAPLAPRLRIAVWGVGDCDLRQQPSLASAELLRSVLIHSPLLLLRDAASGARLQLPGLRAPLPCPSLLAVPRQPHGEGLLHVDNYTTAGAATYERMDAVAGRVCRRRGWGLRRSNNRIPAGDEAAFQACLALYAASSLVLSSALHGCVIAVAAGRPVLAVSGDRKIEAFMQAVGLGAWVLSADPQALPEALLEERLLALPQQQPVAPSRLAAIAAGHHAFAADLRTWLGRPAAAGARER